MLSSCIFPSLETYQLKCGQYYLAFFTGKTQTLFQTYFALGFSIIRTSGRRTGMPKAGIFYISIIIWELNDFIKFNI